jgi:energy-coupling factor transporter ATP-binding protein EcfA2
MPLLDTLLKASVDAESAYILDDAFGGANPAKFIKGMEDVARAVADEMPQDIVPPEEEPWKRISTFLLVDSSVTIRERFGRALDYYQKEVRNALGMAVAARTDEYLAWRNEQQKNSRGRQTTSFYVRTLDRLGYKFRLNLCDDHIECNGTQMTDYKAMEIRTRMQSMGISQYREIEDAYGAEALRLAYHPVKKYMQGCLYDGQDHIGKLACYFTDEYDMFGLWLKKWLVGSVAKVLGNHQNRMLVLDGAQGIGKSSFVRWLAGGLPHYFHEGQIDTYNRRDTEVKLMNTWIWEVSELGGTMARAEMNALKAILSQQLITVRKAYGKHETSKPAMASFVGTINNEAGFLNDFTGSRRYMVSKLLTIDWAYEKTNIDDVWGHAVYLYDSGFKWTLDENEREMANEINETYQIEDVTQSAINHYFEIDEKEVGWFMSTYDIAKKLEEEGLRYGSSNATMMAVGRAMAALGLKKVKRGGMGKQVNGYIGIRAKAVQFGTV